MKGRPRNILSIRPASQQVESARLLELCNQPAATRHDCLYVYLSKDLSELLLLPPLLI